MFKCLTKAIMKIKVDLKALILFCTFIETWTYHSAYTGANQVRVGK